MVVKEPVPVPSEVLLLAIVGLPEVFQQTPLAVTVAPPSFVTEPPPEAEVWVIPVTVLVVTVGRTISGEVVNVTSLPYTVPEVLVA